MYVFVPSLEHFVLSVVMSRENFKFEFSRQTNSEIWNLDALIKILNMFSVFDRDFEVKSSCNVIDIKGSILAIIYAKSAISALQV